MRYPNFYETIEEAQARLYRTVVLYGEHERLPYYVLAITNHKKDGKFRMYLDPIGRNEAERERCRAIYSIASQYPANYPNVGPDLDKALEKDPDCGILRKEMTSPHFNSFRPFPLGMCNQGPQTYYIERQPIRPRMEQGLTQGGLYETLLTAGNRMNNPRTKAEKLDMKSVGFRDCILGSYHSAEETLNALLDPRVANDAHAFHREFAFVRGPCDIMFLAYRSDIIGVLPNNDFSLLRLSREFTHCVEVVSELGLFEQIRRK